jgi:deoxyribonucleoside regulator
MNYYKPYRLLKLQQRRGILLNRRASNPDFKLFMRATHLVCVASGRGKADGLRAGVLGGFINELIVDEPTARLLLENSAPAQQGAAAGRAGVGA